MSMSELEKVNSEETKNDLLEEEMVTQSSYFPRILINRNGGDSRRLDSEDQSEQATILNLPPIKNTTSSPRVSTPKKNPAIRKDEETMTSVESNNNDHSTKSNFVSKLTASPQMTTSSSRSRSSSYSSIISRHHLLTPLSSFGAGIEQADLPDRAQTNGSFHHMLSTLMSPECLSVKDIGRSPLITDATSITSSFSSLDSHDRIIGKLVYRHVCTQLISLLLKV